MDWFPVPELTTPRLALDQPRAQDRDAIVAFAGDLRVSRWLRPVPHPYTAGDADHFIEEIAHSDACFAIRESRGGPLVGVVGISPEGEDAGILGYWIGPPYWGRGYATEAAGAACAHAFGTLGLRRLFSGHFVGNGASANVLTKLGFVETGRSTVWNTALGCECPHIDMRKDAPIAP